jgi:hypothetical protein
MANVTRKSNNKDKSKNQPDQPFKNEKNAKLTGHNMEISYEQY